jgi:hypothetical protein
VGQYGQGSVGIVQKALREHGLGNEPSIEHFDKTHVGKRIRMQAASAPSEEIQGREQARPGSALSTIFSGCWRPLAPHSYGANLAHISDMRTILLKPITAVAVTALSLVSLHANDGDFEPNEPSDHEDCERGGDVDGSELLDQEVRLLPTADAPQGASGKAELEAENEDGVTTATLQIETEGLLEGTYTVSTRSIADGTLTTLGTITVTPTQSSDDEDCDEDDQGEDEDVDDENDDDGVLEITRDGSGDQEDDDQNDGDHHDGAENHTCGDGEFGNDTTFAFPDGFNPLDIAAVEVSDANGVVVLTGDFTNLGHARRSNLQFEVRIAPGHAAPAASGAASLRVRASRHVVRQKFHLGAKNVPANASLTVKINGQPVGHVRTNQFGKVSMRRLPRGIAPHRIYSVSFDTVTGDRVLSAQF